MNSKSRIFSVFEIRDGAEWVADVIRVLAVLVLFGAILFFVSVFSSFKADQRWESECIKRGFAEYNSVTGEWQWKRSLEILPE